MVWWQNDSLGLPDFLARLQLAGEEDEILALQAMLTEFLVRGKKKFGVNFGL